MLSPVPDSCFGLRSDQHTPRTALPPAYPAADRTGFRSDHEGRAERSGGSGRRQV